MDKCHSVPVRESSDPVMFNMSVERADRRMRARNFLVDCYSEENIFSSFYLLSSFMASGYLNLMESQMIWAAQAEKRRTMDMPPEAFELYIKRKKTKERSCLPAFTAIFAFVIFVIFTIDIGWNVWDQMPREMSRILVHVEKNNIEKVDAGWEWRQLLTRVLVHSNFRELVCSTLWSLVCSVFLEARHGSTKVALLSILATAASILIEFAVVPDTKRNVGCWCVATGWRVAHVLTGMNYADIWIHWDLLNLPFHGNMLLYFGLCELIHIVNVNVILLLPPALKSSCLSQNSPGLWNLAGIFYGFCFALPFSRHIRSSNVIGHPGLAYFRRMRVVCVVLNTTAIASLLFALSLLWPRLQRETAGLSHCENWKNEF